MTMTRKMFLAGPFKALVDADTHVMGDAAIDKYTSIIDFGSAMSLLDTSYQAAAAAWTD
ncbi:hypothetical protein [Micrococcus luteus]|uniref:hypothetical protein n=1 Tax=Micrococcus luteus TaxID=1270 RepID=UPI003D34A82B